MTYLLTFILLNTLTYTLILWANGHERDRARNIIQSHSYTDKLTLLFIITFVSFIEFFIDLLCRCVSKLIEYFDRLALTKL